MSLHVPDNFCHTRLAAPVLDTDTVIRVLPGTIPDLQGRSPFPFLIVIHNGNFSKKEICEITDSPGTDLLTAGRGFDGTTALSWFGNEVCEQNVTALHITEMQARATGAPVIVTPNDQGDGIHFDLGITPTSIMLITDGQTSLEGTDFTFTGSVLIMASAFTGNWMRAYIWV